MGEIGEAPPPPSANGISRRSFLKGALALGAVFGLKPLIPELEPTGEGIPLIVDFPPLPDDLAKGQEKELVSKETQPFDIAAFFNRLTSSDYASLEREYLRERKHSPNASMKWPLYGEDGIEHLLKRGLEKEALCLALAAAWSGHGLSVAQHMRDFREAQQEQPSLLGPYEILPLENFVTGFEKLAETDKYGNPYYEVTIDNIGLAEACKKYPSRVVNASFNVGRIHVRIGHRLPERVLADKSKGWVGDEYSGTPQKVSGNMVEYSIPPIAIETAYRDPKNLEALREFTEILTAVGKIVVTATGNSEAMIPDDFKLPEGAFLVGVWNSRADMQKPQHNFIGRPGVVYYVDPVNYSNIMGRVSSAATAEVSEWLAEQGVKSPREAKRLLDKHSRIHIGTNSQVLDIGAVTNIGGYNDWDDPSKYHPVV